MSTLQRETTTRTEHMDEGEIHDVLRNERRRLVLKHLCLNGEYSTLRDLSEAVAEAESGESPAPRNVRDSVYASLHQTHLPKLDSLDVVEYDVDRKRITLAERANELTLYTGVTSDYGFAWYQYYLGVGVIALLGVIAAQLLSLPTLATVGIAATALVLLVGSVAYQIAVKEWPYRLHFRSLVPGSADDGPE